MNRVEEFCNQPRPEVICSELISKHKSKVVTHVGSIASVWWIHSTQWKELLTVVDCSKCTTAWLVIELLFRMANLRIAQPLLLSGPTQNRFKRLKFWLKFLSNLPKSF